MSNLLRITDVARRLGVSANTAGLEDFAASLRK